MSASKKIRLERDRAREALNHILVQVGLLEKGVSVNEAADRHQQIRNLCEAGVMPVDYDSTMPKPRLATSQAQGV